MKINSFLSGCLTTLAVMSGAAFLYRGCQNHYAVSDSVPVTDTIYDTIPIFIDLPVPRDSIVLRYKTVSMPVYDTIKAPFADTLAADSVSVVLPITQKHYSDSTYEAWVSGYEPALDSIKVFLQVTTITNATTNTQIKYKKTRWGIGVQAGVGATPSKLEPYIGLGVTYNIFSW